MATPLPIPAASFADARAVVDGIPHDRQIVLLGESTHGTEEYYRIRADVTKRLIEERGFRAVVFEADWPLMERVNQYTHRLRAKPFDGKEEDMSFPSWMWRNQCMLEFFQWCRARSGQHGRGMKPDGSGFQEEEASVELFGMDCYSLFESKDAVLAFLQRHDPEFAREAKTKLAYLDKFATAHQYGDAKVNGDLSRIAGHIQDVLTRIQARLQWGSKKYECTDVERLSVEQNCEVVIAVSSLFCLVQTDAPRNSPCRVRLHIFLEPSQHLRQL